MGFYKQTIHKKGFHKGERKKGNAYSNMFFFTNRLTNEKV